VEWSEKERCIISEVLAYSKPSTRTYRQTSWSIENPTEKRGKETVVVKLRQ